MTAGKHQLSTHAQGFGTVQVTARLVVRRVKDKNHQDALFPESKHQGVGARWCPQIPTPTPATPGILVERSGRGADMS
jgi:hypothetical protein